MMDDPAQLRRRPVIRVFVSSPFADLKHERDALQRDVFPKLEQFCANRQFQFQAIDLRWGWFGVPRSRGLNRLKAGLQTFTCADWLKPGWKPEFPA